MTDKANPPANLTGTQPSHNCGGSLKTRAFGGAGKSAALTAPFHQTSLSFVTWRISKKQMDACAVAVAAAAAAQLYHCIGGGRGAGGLFV